MDKKNIQQNIIKELGLEGLPEDKQIELLTTMTESVLKRITIKVLEQLSEEDKKEFDQVRETDDPDKISQFLGEKIDNYDEMVEGVIKEFKEEMKSTMTDLEKDLANNFFMSEIRDKYQEPLDGNPSAFSEEVKFEKKDIPEKPSLPDESVSKEQEILELEKKIAEKKQELSQEVVPEKN